MVPAMRPVARISPALSYVSIVALCESMIRTRHRHRRDGLLPLSEWTPGQVHTVVRTFVRTNEGKTI